MAKKINIARAVAGDANINKIGTYKESTGGGTPLKKGEKLKDHPEAKRVQQPRDEDGQFTYNSANAKPLKYGPSRGTTIPPFLKGVELTYAIKKDTVINYNGLTHLAGIDMTANEFIEAFKEYDQEKGFGKLMEETVSRKRGRKSGLEKDVISKGEQGIISKQGEQKEQITNANRADKVPPRGLMKIGSQKEFIDKFNHVKKDIGKVDVNVFSQSAAGKDSDGSGNNKPVAEFDTNLAKSNPKEFLKKNKDKINKMLQIMPKLKASQAVGLIASGKINSISQFKKLVDKKNKK